jgi:hypothetical protein
MLRCKQLQCLMLSVTRCLNLTDQLQTLECNCRCPDSAFHFNNDRPQTACTSYLPTSRW